MANYYSIEELLGFIEPPNKVACYSLYGDNKLLFSRAPGSSHNHQAWEGGYLDHIRETMNIAIALHRNPPFSLRQSDFSLSDVLLVLFLHDLEKPWKYAGEPPVHFATSEEKRKFILNKIDEYEIQLSDDQTNALTYVHGEGEDYSSQRRIMSPLAAFVHCCDIISSRIYFDFPKKSSDESSY